MNPEEGRNRIERWAKEWGQGGDYDALDLYMKGKKAEDRSTRRHEKDGRTSVMLWINRPLKSTIHWAIAIAEH